MNETKKIVFVGLDRAGKTTIIMYILNKFRIIETKPTMGANFSKFPITQWLGLNVNAIDLGGQKKFRKKHLTDNKSFKNVHTLFYTIDIQDPQRYEESLDYFSQIISRIIELKEKPTIFLLYHKYDPEITTNQKVKNNSIILTKKIEKLSNGLEINFFNTSVYDQSSILDMFYQSIIKDSERGVLIDKLLSHYAKVTFSSAALLLDESYLVVGSQYSDKRYREVCLSTAPWIANAMDKVSTYGIDFDKISGDIKFLNNNNDNNDSVNETARTYIQKFNTENNMEFVIVTLSKNPNTFSLSEKHLPVLSKNMSDIIGTMYGR